MPTNASRTVLSLDLEPRQTGPDFRAPILFPPGTPLTIVKAVRDGVPVTAAPFSHVVLSGSTYSVLDDHPTTGPAMELVRDAVSRGIPVMGVCYGHQLIARALLGDDHVGRAPVPEFGWLPIHWNGNGRAWFEGLPNPFRAFVGHFDQVVDLPEDWEVLARTDDCAIHACVNRRLKLFGTQFHPEMDLATGNTCFLLDAAALADVGADAHRIVADGRDDGSGEALFRRFLAWEW